jgi:hypothetical protein
MLRSAPLLLSCVLLLGGCGGERPPASPPAQRAATASQPPGGVQRFRPPVTDVAMLQLQPDGSYKRVCGAPGPAVKSMMDGVLRSRRAAQ